MKPVDHHAQPTLSRRSFLRGHLPATEARIAASWLPPGHYAARSEDVFWAAWADSEGMIIAGDDGIILHEDRGKFTRRQAPAPVPVHALWGVSRQQLWGVGWMGLVLQFDGAKWRKVRGCVQDETGKYAASLENAPLFAITGRADGAAWAVGDHGTILHYDGATWQTESTGVSQHLRTVACLPDGRVLAAGGDGCILIRDTDGSWGNLEHAAKTNFTATLVLEDGKVLLAGGRYFASDNGFRGELFLLSDNQIEPLFVETPFSRFRSLAQRGTDVLMAGDRGQIHRLGQGQLDQLESHTSHDLLNILVLPDNSALVVGDFGTVLSCKEPGQTIRSPSAVPAPEQTLWEPMESDTDRQLWGLWAHPSTGRLYACGEEGVVLVHDRGQWERLPVVGDMGIHALAGLPDGGLLATGQLGRIHHFDGTRWHEEHDVFIDITLLSLWSDDAGNAFAVGDEGLILKRDKDSAEWTRMTSGTKSALYGLWGMDEQHVLAVGDFGLILRWNGTRWDEFNAGTEHFLFDVWGRSLNDIYVVGLSGTIGHFNGTRWIISPVRARSDLLAIAGTDKDVVAVGAAGAVFRRTENRRWQQEAAGTTAGLRAVVAQADGGYVAVGDAGTILVRAPDAR